MAKTRLADNQISGFGNLTIDIFDDGVDYTSGTSTSVTLSIDPGTENNILVFFDGLVQHHDQYSISGTTLTFSETIPLGIDNIEVQIGTTLGVAVPADASVTTAKVADGAIDYTKLAEALKVSMFKRNVIINGNFDIWQRGTGFAAIATNAYPADRFKYKKSGAGAHTVGQSTDVPTYAESGVLSTYSLWADVTTADASIAAGDYYHIQYNVEGYDYARIAGGDATLSFWVKGAKTGTHCVSFRNSGFDRTYVTEYTINATGTWEKKTITVPLTETGGTWNYTNGSGLIIDFVLAAGSTFQTTADSWNSSSAVATSSQVNEMDNVANNFRIAQIQLERGEVATPFEFRHISDELTLCQRYFEKSYNTDVDPGTATLTGELRMYAQNLNVAAHSWGEAVQFKVTKRATPTVTVYNPNSGATGQIYDTVGAVARTSSIATLGANGVLVYATLGSSANINAGFHYTADAEL